MGWLPLTVRPLGQTPRPLRFIIDSAQRNQHWRLRLKNPTARMNTRMRAGTGIHMAQQRLLLRPHQSVQARRCITFPPWIAPQKKPRYAKP